MESKGETVMPRWALFVGRTIAGVTAAVALGAIGWVQNNVTMEAAGVILGLVGGIAYGGRIFSAILSTWFSAGSPPR